ncbi:ABC transporter substrate-binding protein [Nocardia sp. NPDC055165]
MLPSKGAATRGRGSVLAAICAVVLTVAACGSAGDDTVGTGPVKIGLLTSLSGPASSAYTGAAPGAQARFKAYEAAGGKCAGRGFEVLVTDDQSSAQGALSGAQKLIQKDQVYALITVSPLFYGASRWVTTQGKGTPVLGGAFEGAPEWLQAPENNLFAASQIQDYRDTYSTQPDYLKTKGVTKLAAVAYNSPSSQESMRSVMNAAQASGLQRGYVIDTVPFGSTDVGAIVLGIIASGTDAVTMAVNPDTAFAVVAGLRQANYPLKAVMSATGYGSDLLQSAPAVEAGQGVSFLVVGGIAPVESGTPAAKAFSSALERYAGNATGIPSFANIYGWTAADLFLHGLELAGCDASRQDFMSTLRHDATWTAGGLMPEPLDMNTTKYDDLCQYFVKLQGAAFVLDPADGTPICGKLITS